MNTEPTIPFGYRRVEGQSQKGDGIWDAAAQKWRKVKKEYPFCGGQFPILIRPCAVEQTVIPATVEMDTSGIEVMEV